MSIQITELTKTYGTQVAVDNISFHVGPGEIVGFIGPNGSGKSTTMKCLCGILPPDRGNISILDLDVQADALEIKRRIGYLPENNPLYPEMFVKEYLAHVDRYYHNRAGRTQRIRDAIELTGLGREQHKKISQLSKGYRQRVGLAQAIIHDPEVLILDEPTTGLDPNQLVEIRNLVSNLAKNKTVILSTHILQEVEAICDRIVVINQGRIVADDQASRIRGGKQEHQTILIEFSEDIDETLLLELPDIIDVRRLSKREFLVEGKDDRDLRGKIFRFASDRQLTLVTIQQKKESLEEVFRKLTSDN